MCCPAVIRGRNDQGQESAVRGTSRMARIMVCDDDKKMAEDLIVHLRAAGYEAQTCSHTMDVLREAANGHFDLVALGLDLPGFVRANAVEAFREVAPDVALIAFHNHPAEVMQAMARANVAAVLSRPVAVKDFVEAVTRALEQQQVMALQI